MTLFSKRSIAHMPVFQCPEGEGIEDIQVRVNMFEDISRASSDEESSVAAYESPDEFLGDLSDHLAYCQRFISNSISRWTVLPIDNIKQTQLVKTPTASKLPHDAIHPALLRHIQDGGGLDMIAKRLNAPDNYEQKLIDILAAGDSLVPRRLNDLQSLPEGSLERDIQSELQNLLLDLGREMGVYVKCFSSRKMAVGGILAFNHFDIHGETDICLINGDNECIAVFEVKTPETFGVDNWYRNCRGAQVLTALYHFNAPLFLVTGHIWKMFHENATRNAIYTHPTERSAGGTYTGPFANSLKVGSVGREFLKAIIICILARPGTRPPAGDIQPATPVRNTESSRHKMEHSEYKTRDMKTPKDTLRVNPSYYSGKENGVAMYTQVRLFNLKEIEAIDQMLVHERSQATLIK